MIFAHFVDTLNTYADAMRRSDHYELVRYKVYPPVHPDDITEMEHDLSCADDMSGFHVADTVSQFYQVANGLRFVWVYHGYQVDGYEPVGNTNISLLSDIYEPTDSLNDPLPYTLLYEQYRLFDWTGDKEQVVMEFSRGKEEPELYYHCAEDNSYHRLALDITTYMDLLLQTRGLYPWQQFFVADDNFHVDEKRAQRFFVNLARLFPDVDATRFHR